MTSPLAPGNSQVIPTADACTAAELIDLLQKQRVLYGTLAKLSQEQAVIVVGGQTEELLTVLGRRQQLVDHLAKLNGRMEPYRKRWSEIWAGLTPEQQQAAGALVKECQELLARIIAQDETDRQHLQKAKNRLGAELKKINRGGAAMSAYRSQTSHAGPRYTNRQG